MINSLGYKHLSGDVFSSEERYGKIYPLSKYCSEFGDTREEGDKLVD